MPRDVSKRSPYLREKISKRLWRYQKEIYHLVKGDKDRQKTILFIVGCQRSGTTILQRVLERDRNTKVYPETASAVNDPAHRGKLRLKPLPEVEALLSKDRAPFIVLKPLVESQNTPELLAHFSGAKAVWMYRDYFDVISSKIRKAGPYSSIGDLRYVAKDDESDWRVEKLPSAVRKLIKRHFDEGMDFHDASALYWYMRNQFYFSLGLAEREDVILCRYRDVVGSSETAVRRLYHFANQPYPGNDILADIHAKSVGSGEQVPLHPEIKSHCQELLNRLDRVYEESLTV